MSGHFTRRCTLSSPAHGTIAIAGRNTFRTIEVVFQHPESLKLGSFVHDEATDGKLSVRLESLGIPFEDSYVETRVLPIHVVR